jgi:hypothetical protein
MPGRPPQGADGQRFRRVALDPLGHALAHFLGGRLVKVIAAIRRAIFSPITCVLPLPAPASTSSGPLP